MVGANRTERQRVLLDLTLTDGRKIQYGEEIARDSGQATGVYKARLPSTDGEIPVIVKTYDWPPDHPRFRGSTGVRPFYDQINDEHLALQAIQQESRRRGMESVVPVSIDYVDSGLIFLVQGMAVGEDVNDLLEKEEKCSVSEAVTITKGILQALDVLASVGDTTHLGAIIHGDLNKSIFYDRETGRVQLIDFGYMVQEGEVRELIYGTIGRRGKPAYMALEQWIVPSVPFDTEFAGALLSRRADLYTVGIKFAEFLTGRSYEQFVNGELIKRSPTGRISDVYQYWEYRLGDYLKDLPEFFGDDVPMPFQRIILKAMARNPGDRFKTAEEMIQAIDQALLEIQRAHHS